MFNEGELEMRLTDKQLKRFTEKFEIKAESIIMIDKGKKVTIIINGVRIFDVTKELVQEFLQFLLLQLITNMINIIAKSQKMRQIFN